VRAGVRVTFGMAVAALLYVAASPSGPHRGWILAIAALAVLDAVVISRLPFERIAAAGHGTAMLMGWNVAHVAIAAVLCTLDGGPSSPFVGIFFLSVAFAASCLERGPVVVLAALNVLAVFVVALLDAGDPSDTAAALLWAGALVTTAGVCATIAAERSRRVSALHDHKHEVIRRLSRVVEYRDNDTGTHIERMSEYSAAIARRLDLPAAFVEALREASPLHDVGKVAVPDAILLKPGPLTPEERRVMERHAQVGHDMLAGSGSELLDLAAQIALSHHERYDGTGYPNRLAGEDIPLAGRIVAVADVFDALTSDRVYKRAMSVTDAVGIIRRERGAHFDPAVVDAFLLALLDIRGLLPRLEAPLTAPPALVAA
jgi:HD-GYP domain-containing protein (c-di-GMP phosphodiesterase class II)